MQDPVSSRVERYKSQAGAASYNTLYTRSWAKRLATRLEFRVVRRCLDVVGPQESMLDLPSGVGRLFPAYRGAARRYFGMDISVEMMKFAREAMAEAGPAFAGASATHIPLRDGAVDLVFSARLFHHLPDPEVRRRYILELCRVSRRWIVMTFFHTWSLKNILRRLRRPFNRKRPKVTMTTGELRGIAGPAGWEVVKTFPLARLASGHHFAVLHRRDAEPQGRSVGREADPEGAPGGDLRT
jgi:hypothetical protein